MRYSCCARFEDYQTLVELGFNGIEVPGHVVAAMADSEWDSVAEKIVRGPIPCIGCNAALPPKIKMCGPEYDADAVERYANQLCSRMGHLGGKMIGIGSPKSRLLPTGFDLDVAWRQTKEFLALFAQAARPFGITICWETLNVVEAKFGTSFVEDGAIIRELKESGISNLGLVADLFHLLINNNTPEDVSHMADLVCHVYVAEPPVTVRGFPTIDYADRYKELLAPIFAAVPCETISIEAFSGTVASDGSMALALLQSMGYNQR